MPSDLEFGRSECFYLNIRWVMALRVLREKTSHLENLQTHFHTSPRSDQNSLNHPSFAE